MALPDKLTGNRIKLRFGSGINSQISELEIDDSECADGQNFDLNLDNSELKNRAPFDLVGTAPNGEAIRGIMQLEKTDGTLSTLIQAGGTVYEWDGITTFTVVGAVNASAQLRGPKESNWPLDDIVIITDLNQSQPVMTWDGTTFAPLAHDLGGDFFAKYCFVENERAFYANVKSGTATPHMVVGSKRGDNKALTVVNRPASGLNDEDPFFVLAPNFRPINGIITAFDRLIVSTTREMMYQMGAPTTSGLQLSGATAKNFSVVPFYPDSGAVGDEALTYVGNDIAFGRPGTIESVFSSLGQGDIANDDLSRDIANLIEAVDNWTLRYNSRLRKVYCFATDTSRVYVLHKSFLDERRIKALRRQEIVEKSPWSIWVTTHSFGFQPTSTISMRRPSDGLQHVYMGGPGGKLYQVEGSGGSDGGTDNLKVERLSKLFQTPDVGSSFSVVGSISYRKQFAGTVTLSFEYGGLSVFNESITITFAEAENISVWGGDVYWGGDFYFGTKFFGRLTRNPFAIAGRAEQFQVRVTVEGNADLSIQEIDLEFKSV